MTVDLHLHTTASDGRLTPVEVVREAGRKGLSVIAITDHDTVDGIEPALAEAKHYPSLTVIPALEINTDATEGAVHILGYFVDYRSEQLLSSLGALQQCRVSRGQKMIARLAELGVQVDWQRVLELSEGGSIGRPHIAQAMLERGYISCLDEAFVKYIGRKGPAYVKRVRLSPVEAVEMVVSAGGLPVLAHPREIADLEGLLVRLKGVGLVGLEAYYNGYDRRTIARLVGLANKHGLLASGGSDYHGLSGTDETPIGGVEVPLECAQRLMALAKEREAVGR